MNALLAQLSATDLLELTSLASEPIFSTDSFTPESLDHFLSWLTGSRKWAHVCEEALGRSDNRRAWSARARALATGEALPDRLESALQAAWRAHHEQSGLWRKTITGLPVAADAGELLHDVTMIQREVAQLAVLPSALPNSIKEVDAACDAFSKLEKLAADSDSIIQLVAEHAREERRALILTARHTAMEAFDRLESRDRTIEDTTLLTVLRAIPELIRERDRRFIERTRNALSSPSDEFIAELVDKCRIAVPSGREMYYQERPVLPVEAPAIQLSAASQTLLSAELPAPRGLTTTADFETQLKESKLAVNELELGTRWLRTARATSDPDLQRLALGQAFTWLARGYLDRNQSRLATELARDAVTALCLPEPSFVQEVFDAAARTLVATRVWARMTTSKRLPGRPSELADRADEMFKWMRDNDAVDIVSELWADLPDEVDDCFFQVLLVYFAHAIELRYACGESALTAHRLRARPITTARRVLRLIEVTSKSEALAEALHACSSELVAASSPLPSATRQVLTKNADVIRKLLSSRTEDPVAQAIGARFSDLLLRIANADGPEGEPKLSISKSVNVFYPNICSDDVWLPITILNSGGPAPEMSLQVNVEGTDKWRPEIERHEFVVPPLNVDESYTGHALLQLPEKADATTWQFRATLLRGSEILAAAKFNVDVRQRQEHLMRSNPYSAGGAVQEDQFFIGREKQLQQLLDALCADRRDITPLIVGHRRIGKTSLLKKFLRHSEVLLKYSTEFWDVEDLQNRSITVHFLSQLATHARNTLTHAQRDRVRFDRDAFKEDPYAAFEEFCDDVTALKPDRPILVGIDEFDHLVHLAKRGAELMEAGNAPVGPGDILQPQTLGALRKMLMKGGAIRLVLAGLPEILTDTNYGDRMFGLLHRVEVGPFMESEANRVVQMGHPHVVFSAQAKHYLYDVTGMQPYLLQLLCGSIYARVSQSGRDEATIEDIREVVERDILPYETNFTDYLALIRKEDRSLLRALALAQKAVVPRRRFVTPGEVVHELWKQGDTRANVPTVTQHLRALSQQERPLIAESGDNRGKYRLIIGLLTDRLVARAL